MKKKQVIVRVYLPDRDKLKMRGIKEKRTIPEVVNKLLKGNK